MLERRIDWFGDNFIDDTIPLAYVVEYADYKKRCPDIKEPEDYSKDPPIFDYYSPELFGTITEEQNKHNEQLCDKLDKKDINWGDVVKAGTYAAGRIDPNTAPCIYVDSTESNVKINNNATNNRKGWDVNFWATNRTRFHESPYGNFIRMSEYGITFIHPTEVEYLYKNGFDPIWSDLVRPYVITREMMKNKIKFTKNTSLEVYELFAEVKAALALQEPKDRVFYYMNGV